MIFVTIIQNRGSLANLLSHFNKCSTHCCIEGFLPSLGTVMSPAPSGKSLGKAFLKNPGMNSLSGLSSVTGKLIFAVELFSASLLRAFLTHSSMVSLSTVSGTIPFTLGKSFWLNSNSSKALLSHSSSFIFEFSSLRSSSISSSSIVFTSDKDPSAYSDKFSSLIAICL